jgi:hypothetical protein
VLLGYRSAFTLGSAMAPPRDLLLLLGADGCSFPRARTYNRVTSGLFSAGTGGRSGVRGGAFGVIVFSELSCFSGVYRGFPAIDTVFLGKM